MRQFFKTDPEKSCTCHQGRKRQHGPKRKRPAGKHFKQLRTQERPQGPPDALHQTMQPHISTDSVLGSQRTCGCGCSGN